MVIKPCNKNIKIGCAHWLSKREESLVKLHIWEQQKPETYYYKQICRKHLHHKKNINMIYLAVSALHCTKQAFSLSLEEQLKQKEKLRLQQTMKRKERENAINKYRR